jgi:GNAT superfamily N-acetyltransferase
MKLEQSTPESFINSCVKMRKRFFAAKYRGELCAYLMVLRSGETFVAGQQGYIHIGGAFCLPVHRGKGVFQNLLEYAVSALKNEGYSRLGVDFESINPAAYGFWLKYFAAYTHGVARRIDERVLLLKVSRRINTIDSC